MERFKIALHERMATLLKLSTPVANIAQEFKNTSSQVKCERVTQVATGCSYK